jgi:hypothetical protein
MVVDFIGREIKVDDYVTAPWDRGNIELFRVIEIREQGPRLGANKTRRTIQRTSKIARLMLLTKKCIENQINAPWLIPRM